MVDRALTEPETGDLRPPHDSVLPFRKLGNQGVPATRPRLTFHSTVKFGLDLHRTDSGRAAVTWGAASVSNRGQLLVDLGQNLAAVADHNEVLDPDAEPAGQVDARLYRDDVPVG